MKPWRTGLLLLLFLSACKNEPKNGSADVLKKDGMPASVQQLYVQLEKHADSTGLRLRLVNALDSIGAYQPAMAQMDSLLRKDSLNYGLWYRKAQLQQNMHDTSGALKSYRYAIRVYPTADAMLSAANLLAERKDSTALVICKQVETFRIGREYTAHCNFITGVYYARKGNKNKALESFNTCIANDYNYPEAYMEKGFIYYDDKKIKEALAIFQTLVDLKNTYADGYYWLAKCYEALNNKTEAINYYQRSFTLDPGIKEATAALQRLGVK